jgi:putrescine transport system substrate-binding protein
MKSLVVIFSGFLTLSASASELKIYNWTDYIDIAVIEAFEKETQIKVTYDTYDTNELLETKLLAGKSGYDLVFPSGSFLSRQIQAGVFQKLDKAKLPNLTHMWGDIAAKAANYDPGNAFSVTYLWGTTGIGYNSDKVKDAPLTSWKLVYDPAYLAKFKGCGVHFLDSPEDLIPSVLRYLNLDPNSKNKTDYEKAAAHLEKLAPFVTKFHSSEYINGLANGDICLVVGYSGDIKQAAKRATTAKITYVIPDEGAQMWFDQMAIPADAPNAANAHKFIDFMMRPENIAKTSNLTAYANGNLASQKFIDKAVLEDKTIYPTDISTLFTVTPADARLQRDITRLWTKVKTGQ